MKKGTRNLKSLLLILGISACTFFFQNCGPSFQVADLGSTSGSSSLQTSVGEYKQNPFSCTSPGSQAVNSVQRMTQVQYANNLKALVGASTAAQFASLINNLYNDTLKKNVRDFSNTISDNQMTAYQSIAEAIYLYLKANASVVQQLGGSCFSQNPVTLACRDAAIQKLGLLAFRRPLNAAEVTSWTKDFFSLGENSNDGLAVVIYSMMLSPEFLLHFELGDGTSTATPTYTLTPYEVASRLSYGLTDAPPDQALYDAAAAGNLSNLIQVKPHVDRLMQTPEAHTKIKNFFIYWLDPRRYSASNYSPDFLKGLDVNAANDEFARELNEYVDYVIFTKQGTFEDLILGQESFARTAAVADIYGHAPVTDTKPAQMSSVRRGLFMRGPVLANDGNESHPILRGVKMRNRFLCEQFGLPSGINTNDPTFFSDAARAHYSTRERTAGITAGATCMGCHASINPVGFSFENFDSLGRVRPIENAYSVSGTVLAQFPIKTDSPSVNLGARTVAIRDGLDLIDSLVQENVLPGCFVRQVSRFYKLQDESSDDSCMLNSMYNQGIIKPGAPVLETFRQQFLSSSLFKRRMQ